MASTKHQQYPRANHSESPGNGLGTFGWTANPYTSVDDPQSQVDDSDFVSHSHPNTIGIPPDTAAIDFALTAGPTAMAITKVTLWARCAERSFNGTTVAVDLKLYVRPAGGTAYYSSAFPIAGTTNATGYNWQWFSAEWLTNPETGIGWTIEDLNALCAGIWTEDTEVNLGHNSFFNISSFYAEALAVLNVFDIEPRRAVGSMYLRSFRKAPRVVRIGLPAWRSDIQILEQLEAAAIGGPSAKLFYDPNDPGKIVGGWLEAIGSRRDLIVLSAQADPMSGKMDYVCKDMREEEARFWLSGKQSLGFSLDYQGVPIVHPGAGIPTIARLQIAYVQREDGLYVDVPVNVHRFPAGEGWRCEGEQTKNHLLNSTFSQGSGNLFTDWTLVPNGTATITEDQADYLFDADGLRRSLKITNGATIGVDWAWATQDVSLTVGDVVRIRLRYKASAGVSALRFRRLSDNNDYDFGPGTWNAVEFWEALPDSNDVLVETDSDANGDELILTIPSTGSYQIAAGRNAGSNAIVHLYMLEILTVSGAPTVTPAAGSSPVVTTMATVTRVSDRIMIPNRQHAPVWPIFTAGANGENFRGRLYLETKLLFNHGNLGNGDKRVLLLIFYTGRTFHDLLWYERLGASNGRFCFARRVPASGGTTEALAVIGVTGTLLALSGRSFRLLARWTSQHDEYELGVRQLDVFASLVGSTLIKGTGAQWGLDYTDPVEWSALQNCTTRGENGLQKSAGGATWNAAARSTRSIASGDGFVEWLYDLGNGVVVGLSSGAHDLSDPTHDGIEFGTRARWNDGVFEVLELGVVKFTGSALAQGDRTRIAVEGVAVKYYVNGTLQYTSLAVPSYPLFADAALYDDSAPSFFRQACFWGQGLDGDVVGRERDEQFSQQAVVSWQDLPLPHIAHYEWAVQSIIVLESSDRVMLDEEVNKLP